MNELTQIAKDLRRLVEWDQDSGAIGYEHSRQHNDVAATPITPDKAQAIATNDTSNGETPHLKLHDQGRDTIVFGEGHPNAKVLFAGEGPGYKEGHQGQPFAGPAGELLDKMITAMGLTRDEIFISNLVKCNPPKKRDAEPHEIEECRTFLKTQIERIQPKVIVALGGFAAHSLLDTMDGITRMRGEFHLCDGVKLMPTFHPAYLLRNPASKRDVWQDLQQVMAELKKH